MASHISSAWSVRHCLGSSAPANQDATEGAVKGVQRGDDAVSVGQSLAPVESLISD